MRLPLTLCLVSTAALANVVTLDATTETLELETSSASSTDYAVSWMDNASGTLTPGSTTGNVASATDTTIVAAPGASTQRAITVVKVCNAGSTSQTVRLLHDTSGTERMLSRAVLAASECAVWDNNGSLQVRTSAGVPRVQADLPGYSGRTFHWSKVATAIDTIGYHYLVNKDTGFPGAWSVGTPGVNGVSTACDVVGTAGTGGALSTGSHVLPDPATGSWYLTRFGTNAAVANTYQLIDIIWYNTGLTVTTTTNQAIVSTAWGARDVNGSTNGEGVGIALYALTALGNAAAVANTTVSYTNSAGTAGRTATFSAAVGFQAPATAVIGSWMPFTLAAGDTGVRSIQGITLGTTYVTGTMMLVAYRPIQVEGVSVANFPSGSLVSRLPLNPGVRVYNDTCFGIAVIGGIAVTAPSLTAGVVELMER